MLTTREISKLSGASLRQLQYWDENGFLVPYHQSGKRVYSQAQLRQATRMKQMKQTGLSHAMWRELLKEDWQSAVKITHPMVIEGVLVVPARRR